MEGIEIGATPYVNTCVVDKTLDRRWFLPCPKGSCHKKVTAEYKIAAYVLAILLHI
jgi:hypothetical protein